MNKKLLIALVGVFLLAIGAWLALRKGNTTASLDPYETNFAVRDTASVTKIFIAPKSGANPITVERKADGWWVNGKYPVSPSRLNLIMGCIRSIDVKRPLTQAERNGVVQSLAADHIKVEIHTQGQILKTWYIGTDADDHRGSYCLLEGAENPYVCHVKDFTGVLGVMFGASENDWRTRRVLTTTPQTLKRLKIDYYNSPAEGFELIGDQGWFKVTGLAQPDSANLATLLDSWNQGFFVSEFVNFPPAVVDSIYQTPRFASIQVEDSREGQSGVLHLYLSNPEDPRFFGILEKDKSAALIQREAAKRLLLNKAFLAGKKGGTNS